jgi:SAM-dependent methyltransferase
LLPLARAGVTVTGVDNSPAMLAKAREHLAMEPRQVQQRIDLLQADAKTLHLPNKDDAFSLILLPYNTLFHFPEDEIRQLLRQITRYLSPEGKLFIDLNNPFIIDQLPDDHEPSLENVFHDPDQGKTVRQYSQSKLYAAHQRLHITWTFEIEPNTGMDLTETVIEVDYWYQYPHQLELLLRQANFRLDKLLGNYDGAPFNSESERLLILASRIHN